MKFISCAEKNQSKDEILTWCAKSYVKDLFSERYAGEPFTSQDIVFVTDKMKGFIQDSLIDRANKYAAEAKRMHESAEKANHDCNAAITAANILT